MMADPSIALNTFANVMFRFSSSSQCLHTFWKSWEGRMKKPFSATIMSRASSASSSLMAA